MKKLLVSAAVVLSLAAFSSGAFAEKASCEKKCCEKKGDKTLASKDPTAQEVVIDPVCGMDVKVSEAKHSAKYKDKTYYFCSESCKKAFEKDPSNYIGKDSKK